MIGSMGFRNANLDFAPSTMSYQIEHENGKFVEFLPLTLSGAKTLVTHHKKSFKLFAVYNGTYVIKAKAPKTAKLIRVYP